MGDPSQAKIDLNWTPNIYARTMCRNVKWIWRLLQKGSLNNV